MIGYESCDRAKAIFEAEIVEFEEEETDPESRKMFRQAGRFAAVGLEIGLAMAIGILGGSYLDDYFGTKPILFWSGFVFGIGAAAKAIIEVSRTARKQLDGSTKPKKD